MRREARAGTTLVELVVALALAALVLLSARALLGAVSDSGTRARRRVVANDEQGMGMSLLRDALRTAVSLETGGAPFSGDARSLLFSTRCATGGGWSRPCRLEVRIDRHADSSSIVISEPGRADQRGLSAAGPLSFRYIRLGPQGEGWLDTWGQAIARPAAVAIVGTTDTLVLTVTGR